MTPKLLARGNGARPGWLPLGMHADGTSRDSRRTLVAITVALFLLVPTAYVLGIGPAARLAHDVPATAPVLSALYVPLESTAITYGLPLRTYACYMELWGVPMQPVGPERLCQSREFW